MNVISVSDSKIEKKLLVTIWTRQFNSSNWLEPLEIRVKLWKNPFYWRLTSLNRKIGWLLTQIGWIAHAKCIFGLRVCYHHMRATKIDIKTFIWRKCFSCASFLLRIIKHFNETKFQSLFSNLRKLRQCTLQCIAFKRFQLNVNYMDVSIFIVDQLFSADFSRFGRS